MKTGKRLDDRGWNRAATEKLVGRTIVKAEYMDEDEQRAHGWHSRPVILYLDNGSRIYPSQDDEGNDGGSLFGTDQPRVGEDDADLDGGDDWQLPVLRD
jgi:hypothetical protein